ncbi:hypothetical protein V0288_18860 [Pannus brasiliensis CCIBt3594]|uniref:Uncharacterized protein n=1 Tax=Pannus brasiliensis CCIBt3594 TaxID=1427578 RepID=A0AAW9R0D9_9CHRO
MVKLTAPLQYSIAILAGGIVLVAGVRAWKIPNVVIFPAAALVTVVTAIGFKAIEPDPEKLAREEIDRELRNLKVSGQELALRAGFVRQEARQILSREVEYQKLFARIEKTCEPFAEIVPKIEEFGRQIPRKNARVCLAELKKELDSARDLVSSSRGSARQQAEEFVTALEKNLELAKTGNSVTLAKLLQLQAIVQDATELLQDVQNKVRTIRRRGVDRVAEIGELRERLQGISRILEILIR